MVEDFKVGDSKCGCYNMFFDENQNIFYFTRQDTLFYNFTLFFTTIQSSVYLFIFFYNTIYIITLYDDSNIYTPSSCDQFLFSLLCVYFYSKIFQHIKYLKKQFKIVQSSSEYIPLINIIPCVTPAPKVHLKSLSLSTGL